jgi:hypothetical protein
MQFFIIYVPSQQLQGQLQTQRTVDTCNYITDKHTINSKLIKGKHWRKQQINAENKTKNKVIIIIIQFKIIFIIIIISVVG